MIERVAIIKARSHPNQKPLQLSEEHTTIIFLTSKADADPGRARALETGTISYQRRLLN